MATAVTKILTLLFVSSPLFSTPIKWSMAVGESKTIEITQGAEVDISKKGILRLSQIEGDRFLLTALRKGFVVFTVISDTNPHSFHITVSNSGNPLKQDSLARLCNQQGIKCEYSTRTVSGTIFELNHFIEIENLCLKHGCYNQTQLNLDSIDKLKTSLIKMNSGLDSFVISRTGNIRFMMACEKHSISKMTFMKQESKKIFISHPLNHRISYHCNTTESYNLYKVNLFARLVFESSNSRVQYYKHNSHLNIENEKTESTSKIIGDPTFLVMDGIKSQIQSGGEFIHEVNEENRVIQKWKQYGIDFTTTVSKVFSKENTVLISFHLIISSPSGSGYRSLRRHELKGQIPIMLGEVVEIGRIRIASDGYSQSNPILIEKIPILGPLFQSSDSKHSSNHLVLRVLVSEFLAH